MLEQFAELEIEEVREEKPAYEPGEHVPVWRKSVGNIIISLERLKATPALYLRVFHGGSPVFEYGPFFSRRSFNLGREDWESLAAELEKRGERPLVVLKPSDWELLVKEVYNKVPESPILPPVAEVGDPVPVTVEDLERHGDNYLLRPVEFEGIIVGRSEIKTVPVAVRVVKKVGKEEREMVKVFDLRSPQEAVKFITGSGEKLDEARFFILQLQQPMGHSRFTVYVVGREVPKSKSVRVRGIVVSEGRKPPFKVVVLSTEIEPLNEIVERLTVTPELLKEGGFKASSYEELKRVIDENFAPKIRGRPLAKLAYALTLFSVERLSYGGTMEKGIIRTLFFGDTATGKSSIAKWAYETLGVGAYTVAETGSRAGLLYTVDTETRTVIWGAVTLADREYAVIDGFDKMHPEEIMEFREAITNEEVVVAKKAQGRAPFRVRLVLCSNAERPLNEYLYPIEALMGIPPFKGRDGGASMRRIDLFIPFSAEDVPARDIVAAALMEPKVDAKSLKMKLLLAWKVSRAVYEPGALTQLQRIALNMIGQYGSMKPPVIHNDYLRVVMKVAAAFASLLGRYRLTGDGLEVVVTEDVVPFVESFFGEYLAALKLETFFATSQADVNALLEEVKKDGILEKALRILYERTRHGTPINKTILGEALGIRKHDRQQELVSRLVQLNLVISKPGVGLLLTSEGRRVAKKLFEEEEEKVGVFLPDSPHPRVIVPCEGDYLKVRGANQAETTRAPVSESEVSDNPSKQAPERSSKTETLDNPLEQPYKADSQRPPTSGSKVEVSDNPLYGGLSHGDGRISGKIPHFVTTAGSEEEEEGSEKFQRFKVVLAGRLRRQGVMLRSDVYSLAEEHGVSRRLVDRLLLDWRMNGIVSIMEREEGEVVVWLD